MKIKFNSYLFLGAFFIIAVVWYGVVFFTGMNDGKKNEYLALGEFYTKKCSVYNSEDLIYKDKFKDKTLIKCDNSIYFVDSITYRNGIEYYQQYVKEKLN
ncbi:MULTISPECIES: hypothetical protein [unclassified Providencia]|uniref:hypothetical protein n=1 Tax=unclassified Providencia TaxID=2633465 RepID=UPI00234AFEFD|nr:MULTISPECIES: hypothetical protein [unclassified Providencia]